MTGGIPPGIAFAPHLCLANSYPRPRGPADFWRDGSSDPLLSNWQRLLLLQLLRGQQHRLLSLCQGFFMAQQRKKTINSRMETADKCIFILLHPIFSIYGSFHTKSSCPHPLHLPSSFFCCRQRPDRDPSSQHACIGLLVCHDSRTDAQQYAKIAPLVIGVLGAVFQGGFKTKVDTADSVFLSTWKHPLLRVRYITNQIKPTDTSS
jgi:hypothetical protein